MNKKENNKMLTRLFKRFCRRPDVVVYKNGKKYYFNTFSEAYRFTTK